MKSETELNKLAAEAMGICAEHEWYNETSSGFVLCRKCKRSKHHESTYPDFCNDLNAAQKFWDFAGQALPSGTEGSLGRTWLYLHVGDDCPDERIDLLHDHDLALTIALGASAKPKTVVALVALGKLTPEQAKEVLNDDN